MGCTNSSLKEQKNEISEEKVFTRRISNDLENSINNKQLLENMNIINIEEECNMKTAPASLKNGHLRRLMNKPPGENDFEGETIFNAENSLKLQIEEYISSSEKEGSEDEDDVEMLCSDDQQITLEDITTTGGEFVLVHTVTFQLLLLIDDFLQMLPQQTVLTHYL